MQAYKRNMKNYYIVNKETSTYWRTFYNNSIGFKKYYRIWDSKYVKEYLYNQYDGICQFCNKPLKDNFVVHHTTYNRECDYIDALEKSVMDYKHSFCEECAKKSTDCFNKCMRLLRPVCAHCNMTIDRIAARFILPTDESIPGSQRGYYFMKEEIIRMNQFLRWVALSNKCEFPKTERLHSLYMRFSEYDYTNGLYRIWGRIRIPKESKLNAIFFDKEDMNLLFDLISRGINELELKDNDFVNLYKRLRMIDQTSEYYIFIALQNNMDDHGKLRRN